ncbi:MAG: PTS transporter subunit EIIC [Lachnospiraceae bacterium]|nr:PTS transporter subunit EIIC [Lachnospiraceae bacterium]
MENTEKSKKRIGKLIVDNITGIFVPIINYLTAASILKSVIVLLAGFGVLDTAGGVYQIFYAVSDGFFYFLPVFLAITASKQWKTDMYISLLIPVAMLYPDLVAILENGKSLSLLGLTAQPAIYHSGVIPVLLAVGLLHFVEIPCDKFLPGAIKGFLKPIICCLVVLPFTFLLFGPVGSWIGSGLTKLFFLLYDWNAVIAGIFMGFLIQPMVVVGGHWSIVPVSISSIATNGYDVILPLLGGAVYGQCGACLAMGILYREKEQKTIAFQAALSAALGVTEPSLYGVTLKTPRAMISACIAGACGGAIAGIAGAHCTSFAFPSFITSVAYVGPGFVWFLVSMAVALPIGFVLTIIQKKALMKNI